MSHLKKITLKHVLIVLVGGIFLAWDLYQANSSAFTYAYQPSFPATSKAGTMLQTTVAIVRSDDSALPNPTPVTDANISYATIEQMVRRSVALAGGFTGVIASGDTVLIKPNIVQQDSSGSGGVTDVRVVKALVKMIDEIDHGHIHIIVGDGSPRPFTTFERIAGPGRRAWTQLYDVPGYQILKTEMLAAGIDFRISNLNGNSDTNPWPELQFVQVPGGGEAQPQGGAYYVHQDVVNANVFITVPVMKIHEPGITAALKNQIGIASSSRYGFSKTAGVPQNSYQTRLRHLEEAPYNWTDKEIVDLCLIGKIKFVVVDAIACLETQKSPVPSGVPSNQIVNQVRMNTVLAGKDPVAVDHVCALLMGLNPDDVEHITLAERRGLGTNNPNLISIAGASIESARKRFKKNQTASGVYGQGNREWTLNGPFPIGAISDPINYEFIQNEASVAPIPGNAGWSQRRYFINDRIALKDYYNLGSDQVVSYAFTYFFAPTACTAELWIGSDEALKVFLNGTQVYNFNAIRTFANSDYFSEIVQINLTQGVNRLLVKSLQRSGRYDFSVNICDVESNAVYRGNRIWGLKFSADATTLSVGTRQSSPPQAFELLECYPNPFNGALHIPFRIAGNSNVDLAIYNVVGQRIRTLVRENLDAQTRSVVWNGTNDLGREVASGLYFVIMRSGERTQARKVVYVR
ncbi:MAG: DUF362 domain-containing protein [Ignavibacteriae bacterium]|nr:DUF362 domain-containing protein [Ignavibacteriota bacterium]